MTGYEFAGLCKYTHSTGAAVTGAIASVCHSAHELIIRYLKEGENIKRTTHFYNLVCPRVVKWK